MKRKGVTSPQSLPTPSNSPLSSGEGTGRVRNSGVFKVVETTIVEQQQKIMHDLDAMQEIFGDYPETELLYHTPFQLLMSVMLSAQTTDKQVNRVTEKFYDRILTPRDVVDLGEEQFYSLIQGVNYSRTKAKHIFHTAQILQTTDSILQDASFVGSLKSEVGGQYGIPKTLGELIKLPGVGVKTAKVVLYILYKQKHIAVDTHVHRVAHRLGRVTNLSPEKTSDALETLIPDTYKDIAHRVMIYFGRYLCKAQKPECERCPLQDHCLWYRGQREKKEKR